MAAEILTFDQASMTKIASVVRRLLAEPRNDPGRDRQWPGYLNRAQMFGTTSTCQEFPTYPEEQANPDTYCVCLQEWHFTEEPGQQEISKISWAQYVVARIWNADDETEYLPEGSPVKVWPVPTRRGIRWWMEGIPGSSSSSPSESSPSESSPSESSPSESSPSESSPSESSPSESSPSESSPSESSPSESSPSESSPSESSPSESSPSESSPSESSPSESSPSESSPSESSPSESSPSDSSSSSPLGPCGDCWYVFTDTAEPCTMGGGLETGEWVLVDNCTGDCVCVAGAPEECGTYYGEIRGASACEEPE